MIDPFSESGEIILSSKTMLDEYYITEWIYWAKDAFS